MTIHRYILSVLLLITAAGALAGEPRVKAPLPALEITDRGELTFVNDEFDYSPWSSEHNPGMVHIVQYFGGTMADSERFKPFTNLLQETLPLGTYHVTTIINLDAALWGTSGFIVSEVKDSKRKFPMSTLVLDEEGTGVQAWQLGEDGAGLAVIDKRGIVRYFTREPMGPEEMTATLDLVRADIDS
jgi:YtfJ family uncharacterized protein